MITIRNSDVPEWAKWFELTLFSTDRVKREMIAGILSEELEDEKDRRTDMLLAEIKDEQDPEEVEKDKLIESLQASNRELAHRVDDLMQWREHYKSLYEKLLDEVLDRVNRE